MLILKFAHFSEKSLLVIITKQAGTKMHLDGRKRTKYYYGYIPSRMNIQPTNTRNIATVCMTCTPEKKEEKENLKIHTKREKKKKNSKERNAKQKKKYETDMRSGRRPSPDGARLAVCWYEQSYV